MRRAPPLSVQLLVTFVGLLVGTTAVLTRAAYTTLRANLEAEAGRHVELATRAGEEGLAQLFRLRQQRAEGFLASVESLCAEPVRGRLAWVDDCVRTMVSDFREGERAAGAVLRFRGRLIRRSGTLVPQVKTSSGVLTGVIRRPNGAVEYGMRAVHRETTLDLLFEDDAVEQLFRGRSGVGRSADVVLVDGDGHFLAPADLRSMIPDPERAAGLRRRCQAGGTITDVDYRGLQAFQSSRPVPALGDACVTASIAYDDMLAPAERLRAALVARGTWFVIVAVVLSLLAAQWIAAPVRRLAQSAHALQAGRFGPPIRLAGPSEVRALGRAFNAMSDDLAALVASEQTARRHAEQANHAKDDFLAAVSHELRTPLNAILGWAQMLRSDRLPADQARHGIAVIERNARSQSQLIDDLLDVSRIVSNRLRLTRGPVQLAEVVESALDAVRPQAVAKQVSLEVDLTGSPTVLGDPRRLEQVVWNILWNAVKFTEASGHVTVRLVRVDRVVTLTVTDTGVGISSAFLPQVFEWFRQEDARSRSQSGLGLGLGIVRHLVELHGGTVSAESAGLGHGATFTVTLPAHDPATSLLGTPPPDQALPFVPHCLDAARVFVVEDDQDTREILRATLETAGASVEVVSSAGDARRELLMDARDVLISDIRMPEEDGYSLLRSLRGAGIETPAIALTAYARREDADEAFAAGFQMHLPKPVDAGLLVEAVATLLRRHTIH
jgi:signal transduction histidine kinase